MATLKEHQAAMVDLLANGSGIPASASRLAHAMHDVLEAMMVQVREESMQQSKDFIRKYLNDRADATTPGLNDKALSKREKALKTDSPAKWPTPAEQRVKEMENTIRQLKANNAKLRNERDNCYSMWQNELTRNANKLLGLPEQAGCRKPGTDIPDCWHSWIKSPLGDYEVCAKCGVKPMDVFRPTKHDTQVCEHEIIADLRAHVLGMSYPCIHCGETVEV